VREAAAGKLAGVKTVERVVVAGAGLAGLRTAEGLRARGYAGQVTMVGAERHRPYDRPPLSKAFLAGKVDDTSLDSGALSSSTLGLDLRLGETAVGLGDGVLHTDRGEVDFGALVVATGSEPVAVPGGRPQQFLRTIDDARRIRDRLLPGLRLAVIGAGWIGAELATAAAARGCRVTVVEAAGAPLAAAVGADVGARTVPWYGAAGVDLRLGTPVEAVTGEGVAIAGGELLPADEIVTAVGIRPVTGWLDGSGIKLDNGVAVDEGMRTSLPGVFAAGDCAAFWSRRYRRRLRVEHWDNALHAPEVAAANLLGEDGGNAVYDPVPYFWSEQFGRMVQYAGYHPAGSRLLWRGDPAGERWTACWLAGGTLAAVLTVDRPKDLVQARRLISSGAAVDPERLADPGTPVRATAIG
jgi:3-phenylpropionate/trans-cinnamate dioxygenase ferredoxin reductase component